MCYRQTLCFSLLPIQNLHQLQDGLHRVQELARSGLLLRWCPNSFMVMNIPVEVLKSERLKRNYTQEYIADKLGVSPSRVSRWETGRTEMKVSEMERYAAVIGIDPSISMHSVQVLQIAEQHLCLLPELTLTSLLRQGMPESSRCCRISGYDI